MLKLSLERREPLRWRTRSRRVDAEVMKHPGRGKAQRTRRQAARDRGRSAPAAVELVPYWGDVQRDAGCPLGYPASHTNPERLKVDLDPPARKPDGGLKPRKAPPSRTPATPCP
ncbi:MAG: hypothetical protein MZV65_39400 [Chromatiales bacterium]|nr:hypothetical protein [Chromatiales bacterium]